MDNEQVGGGGIHHSTLNWWLGHHHINSSSHHHINPSPSKFQLRNSQNFCQKNL
jgi:hypothetical protein